MSVFVVLSLGTIGYPKGGGHIWAYLNWALSLRSIGCRVLWLENVKSGTPPDRLATNLKLLKECLEPFGLDDAVVLAGQDGEAPDIAEAGHLPLEATDGADLLLNLKYNLNADVVGRFKRSALIDIDPGLLQLWMEQRAIVVAPHDLYFSIGETVAGRTVPGASDATRWLYTPPCVSLDHWPVVAANSDAPFTTVTHWFAEEWVEYDGEVYRNDKRTGFLPFLDLPGLTPEHLELATYFRKIPAERLSLLQRGWLLRESTDVASTPLAYRRYIQASKGEFSCAKPSYVRLKNAWISDRTICYLASGKPAVVQHTGQSRFLPDRAGLLRFRDLSEAALCIEHASSHYLEHSAKARTLAEEYFDGRKVVRTVIERCLN